MVADIVHGDAVIGAPDRPRKTRAGRSDGLEAEQLERPRAADIPWVRQHEAAALVQLLERGAFFRGRYRHGVLLPVSPLTLAGSFGLINDNTSAIIEV